MLIRVINPNTTVAMTEVIGRAARAVVADSTSVEAVTSRSGPASIESHFEEALAVPGLLELIDEGERAGVDGYVIACFGDPGLDAARELARGPVLGIAEAAMHAATLVGRRFGVVTTLERTIGRASELAHRYGAANACVGIRACEVPVLELDDPSSGARDRVIAECLPLLEAGAESIVLGCAGMADFCRSLSRELGVPVVDGVAAATALVEALIRVGLRTSTRSEYAPPPRKAMTGGVASFSRTPGLVGSHPPLP